MAAAAARTGGRDCVVVADLRAHGLHRRTRMAPFVEDDLNCGRVIPNKELLLLVLVA